MTILILNKRALRTTPYFQWIPESRTNVVLFTAMANQSPEAISQARVLYRSVEVFDHYDTTGWIEMAALKIHTESPITAIVALSEVDLVRAAELRERLGLAGQSVASALAFRDKFVMKCYARDAGINVASMAAVGSPLDLISFVETNGYPLVVKPRTGAGTGGVVVLHNQKDLETYLAKGLMTSFDGSIHLLAETFVAGQMYHVDGIFSNGQVLASCPHIYTNDGLTVMTEGASLGGWGLDPSNPIRPRLQEFAAATLKALPSPPVATAFHLEVWHTADDRLVLCEVASRAGGNGINDMVREEIGVDMCATAARAQAGVALAPSAPQSEPRCLGAWLNVQPEHGIFVSGPKNCELPFVTDYQLTGVAGRQYAAASTSTATVATFVFVADTATELKERHEAIERWFHERTLWQKEA